MANLKSTSEIVLLHLHTGSNVKVYAILHTLFNTMIYNRCFLVFVGPDVVDLHRKRQLESETFL